MYFFLKLGKDLFASKSSTGFCLWAWSPLHLNQKYPSFVSNDLWVRASLFFFFSFSTWNSLNQVFTTEIRRGSINSFYNEGGQS